MKCSVCKKPGPPDGVPLHRNKIIDEAGKTLDSEVVSFIDETTP